LRQNELSVVSTGVTDVQLHPLTVHIADLQASLDFQ
jgi:hypothetical protein